MSDDEKGLGVEDGVVVMRSGLTDEERERLNGVRKQIWRGGYAGLLGGGILGLGNCAMFNVVQTRLSQQFPKHPVVKTLPRLQNKHYVMWTLVSGAVGMFLGAGVEGTRASESLRDIYEKRANEAKNDRERMVVRTRHSPNEPEYHVAKASADSHQRRRAAIEAAKKLEEAGERGSSHNGSEFKPW